MLFKRITLSLIFGFSIHVSAQLQQGPQSPSSSSSGICSFSYSSGLNIAPGANVFASDNVYATASHCACCDANTACLKMTGFGFTIPPTATINGILVEVEKRASSGSSVQDNGFRIVKNGAETGTSHAQIGINWPYTDTYVSYGGPADLWGTTWTAADINASDFGMILATIDYSCSGVQTTYIDHVRITVFYTGCTNSTTAGFTSVQSGLTASFTDASTNAISRIWDFGDGNGTTALNPSHTYAAPGTYNVCLITADSCTTDTFCTEIDVCFDPVAGFDISSAALSVSFSDTSGFADAWYWDFGDGTSSTQQNPVHTFDTAGSYQVCLIASNDCTSDTTCTVVKVCGPPSAAFAVGINGNSVNFTAAGTGNTFWEWDFGDGAASSLQNPVHSYQQPGTYNVCLIAGNECTSDTSCINVVITEPFGIAETDETWFSVYPNPAGELVYLQAWQENAAIVSLTIADMQGKVVLAKELTVTEGADIPLDISALPAGAYVVRATSEYREARGQLIIRR